MHHKRIATSAEVYAVIFARHRDQLRAFASFSDPEGAQAGGDTGRMDTAWGLVGADCPLLEVRTTWPITRDEHGEAKAGERHSEYWICYPVEEA